MSLKRCFLCFPAMVGLLFAPAIWAQNKSLTAVLEEEAPFYMNYGLEPYSKQAIQSEVTSYYDFFGAHIVDGFFVYEASNDKKGFHLSENADFDSTKSSRSLEQAQNTFFDNFQNLIVTRDAIGGTKSTFLVGDQIRTRFTPFTLDKRNFKGIRWDLWTSGIKFSALATRIRPGVVANSNSSARAPVTYPINDSSFVDRGTDTWLTTNSMVEGQYLSADYSNKSPYGDYEYLWALHAENDLANVLQYGITYMNHHVSDVSRGEKWSGDVPDKWAPDEIHFEFYDLTMLRTDDAGCYVNTVTMTLNNDPTPIQPKSIFRIDPIDTTLFTSSLPDVANGWEPIVVAFEPPLQKPALMQENQIKHVNFTYSVGGNYLVFVSTDRFIPLAILATINTDVTPQEVTFDEPRTATLRDYFESGQTGPPISLSSNAGSPGYGATYFGDYIAKSPKPMNQPVTKGTPPPNLRTYTYEYKVNVNSVTYGANFKGKLYGINFSGEVATNAKEGKYPGALNTLDDYSKQMVRRNVLQFKADRDFGKMLNFAAELFSVAPGWETNMSVPQPSRYISRTAISAPTSANQDDKNKPYDYMIHPFPLSSEWTTVDDNEDQDPYVENNRRPYPSDYSAGAGAEFFYDGLLKTSNRKMYQDHTDTLGLPTGMMRNYDDKDGVISNRYDRNKNGIVDYREDFLLFYTDPPVFELENDMNFNGIPDYEDDDLLPDYPYYLPYTLTSNAIITHGLQGVRGKLKFEPLSGLVLNIGTRLESALNMNATGKATSADKPGVGEGKSSIWFGNAMLKVTRRGQGIDFFVGDEAYYVQDGIRNDVVQTGAGLDPTKAVAGDLSFHYLTDPMRYRSAVINNLVAGLTYMSIPNLAWDMRAMMGLESHIARKDSLYNIKTRPDYTYQGVWERYPGRTIAKANLVNKLGYTQKWNLEYEGWKSAINLLNRFTIEPQYKISYEFRRNTKEKGTDADPRKNPLYSRPDKLSPADYNEYLNRWQEYDANTEDFILSVPILRANFMIAEKTKLETGIEWMKTFDRISETNSKARTVRIAQIVNRDNYAGYNVALMIGLQSYDDNFDVNLRDNDLKLGSEFNEYYSQVFAKIYAGL